MLAVGVMLIVGGTLAYGYERARARARASGSYGVRTRDVWDVHEAPTQSPDWLRAASYTLGGDPLAAALLATGAKGGGAATDDG